MKGRETDEETVETSRQSVRIGDAQREEREGIGAGEDGSQNEETGGVGGWSVAFGVDGGAEEGGEERRGGLTFPGVRWLRKLSLYCRHALARTLALTLARPALWLIALVDQPELWLIHLSG